MGAAPAREAKAASDRKRPGCDQELRSWAAVMGPTPGSARSVGARAWTSWWSSNSSSPASVVSAIARRAVERRARIVARCSVEWAGQVRRREQRCSCPWVVSCRSWWRSWSGALMISAFQLAHCLGAGENGAFAAGEQDAQRLPVAASPRLGEVLPGERFPGCACGVKPVGLGAVAAGRARRPVDLDYPLALLEQEAGQSGAEAARALDRPYPLSRRPLAHEAQQTPGSRPRLRSPSPPRPPPRSMCTPRPCASRGACRRRSRTPPDLPACPSRPPR